MNWTLLANSLLVASASTLLALLIGFGVALVLAFASSAVQRLVFLPVNIFSLGGAVWILGSVLWPIPALALWSAWQKLEPASFEIDALLRGTNLMRLLLLPAARSHLVLSAAVVVALALNNFAVPTILQVKVFTSEVWVSFNSNLDTFGALRLSWPLVLVPLCLLLLLRRSGVPWPRETASASAPIFRRQLGTAWSSISILMTAFALLTSLVIPLTQLVATSRTWNELLPALSAGRNAVINSLAYSISAAIIAIVLACVLARLRSLGWLWLFFLMPGVLLGIGAITLFNRSGLEWFSRTAAIAIAVLVIRYLAVARSIVRRGFASLDPDLVDAARLDGARGATLFRRVIFPQVAPEIAAAAYLVYVLCLWDVETILLVIPPGGETLALRIFNLLHYGHNAHVNALCLLLLLLALAPLILFGVWRVLKTGRLNYPNCDSYADTEPQLGSISQPSLATKELRWVAELMRFNPERVAARANSRRARKLIQSLQGCFFFTSSRPGVACSSQPWAERWNPFRILFSGALLFLMVGCGKQVREHSNHSPLHSSIFSHVEIIGSRGTGPGEFNKPRSLTLDTNDNLFVVDMTGRVQKFSPDGKFLLSWQMPQTDLGKPKGMCRDRQGNILVLEPHYQRVNHFTPDGKLVTQWGVQGTNAGELTLPRAVAVDTKNNVIVSEYTIVDRVQKFSANGQRCLTTWGTPGLANGEFNRAEGVCVDTSDRIYVADSCNHRIQIFSPDGKFLRAYGQAGESAGEMSYPYDIAVDEQARQYVCEFGNSRIQVFDAHDHPLEIIGHAGGAAGEFANPWSIALDSKGNLYVADSQNHRVQKLIRKKNV